MNPNNPEKYTPTAIALHWIVAVIVIGMIVGAKLVDVLPKDFEPFLVGPHKAFGIIVFLLVGLRLFWRLTHKPPPLPPGTGPVQAFAAHAAHWSLYSLMVVLPISGIAWQFLRGRGIDFWLFAINSPFVDDRAAARPYSSLHRFLGDVILVLVIVHILAALYHQFFKSDGLMSRMTPKRGD